MNSYNVKFETEPCPKYAWFMALIQLILTLDHISIQHSGSFCLLCPLISFVFLIRWKCLSLFTFPYMNTHRQITSAPVPTWPLLIFYAFPLSSSPPFIDHRWIRSSWLYCKACYFISNSPCYSPHYYIS